MGKGQIIAHKGDGKYDVRLIYAYRNRITAKLVAISGEIAELEIKITALILDIGTEFATNLKKEEQLAILRLQKAAAQKLYDYYSTKMPADPAVEAWCADLTEDMAYGTNVGTIEIPGEATTVLIRPAYNNRAVYSSPRDGQLMPAIAGSAHQVLFNRMLLPGWQRHKPIYRIGTISEIDYDANTCSVCLTPAFSSQQNLPAVDGLSVAACGATALAGAADFCSRYPGHPFCTNIEEGSEIYLDAGQLAQLQAVNSDVNLNYGRQNDPSGYRLGDSWDVMDPGGSGDCEDFVLTKMQQLVDTYGWSPANLKLVTGYTKTGVYHAMLGVRTSNRGLMILDVNNDPVVESTKLPYRIDRIAMTSTSWKNYTRILIAVPVEYMNCNAGAFAVGDRVVVQFIDQKWETPKVVGFVENPQACTFDALVLGNFGLGINDWSFFRYLYDTDAWQAGGYPGEIPGNEYYQPDGWIVRGLMFATTYGTEAFLFGGMDFMYYPYDPDETTPVPECNFSPGCFPHPYDRADKMNWLSLSKTALQAMPAAKGYGGGFRLGTRSYCIAGAHDITVPVPLEDSFTGARTITIKDSNFEYDHLAGTWATKASHPTARMFSRDFILSGKGFSLGGLTAYSPSVPVQFVFDNGNSGYDQAGDAWTAYHQMNRGRWQFACGALKGEGYIFGSHTDVAASGDVALAYDKFTTNWVEKYNFQGDAWSYVQELYDDPGFYTFSAGIAANNGEFGLGWIKRYWSEYNATTGVRTQKAQYAARITEPHEISILVA